MLGYANIDAMLLEITPQQLDEWSASERLDPFLDHWRPFAVVAAEISNRLLDLTEAFYAANGGKFKAKRRKESDFVPHYKPPEKKISRRKYWENVQSFMHAATYKKR